jgi:hypothetical protein
MGIFEITDILDLIQLFVIVQIVVWILMFINSNLKKPRGIIELISYFVFMIFSYIPFYNMIMLKVYLFDDSKHFHADDHYGYNTTVTSEGHTQDALRMIYYATAIFFELVFIGFTLFLAFFNLWFLIFFIFNGLNFIIMKNLDQKIEEKKEKNERNEINRKQREIEAEREEVPGSIIGNSFINLPKYKQDLVLEIVGSYPNEGVLSGKNLEKLMALVIVNIDLFEGKSSYEKKMLYEAICLKVEPNENSNLIKSNSIKPIENSNLIKSNSNWFGIENSHPKETEIIIENAREIVSILGIGCSSISDYNRKKILNMGENLNRIGGFDLMSKVANKAKKMNDDVSSNLDSIWGGIGNWGVWGNMEEFRNF